jgi:ribosomal protein L35AE/L33A
VQLLLYHLQLMGVSSGTHLLQLQPLMETLHGSSHFRVAGLKFRSPRHIIGSLVQLLLYHLQLMGVSSGSHFMQLHPGMLILHGSSHFPVAGLKFKLPRQNLGSLVQLLLYHLQLMEVNSGSHFVQLHPVILSLHGCSLFPGPGLKFRSPGHTFGFLVQLSLYHLQLIGFSSGSHFVQLQPAISTIHGSSHFRVAGLKLRLPGHNIGSLVQLFLYHLQFIGVSSGSHCVQPHPVMLTLHGSSHCLVAGLKFRSPGHIFGSLVQPLMYHLQ